MGWIKGLARLLSSGESCDLTSLQKHTYQAHQNPMVLQISSTLDFTSSGIVSICGQGRMKPSAAHFLVASIPIFDP